MVIGCLCFHDFFFHPFKISVAILFIDPSLFYFCFRRKSRGKASKGRKRWKSTQTWINLSFINLHANVKFVFDSLSQIMNYPNRWKKILCCPKIDIPFPPCWTSLLCALSSRVNYVFSWYWKPFLYFFFLFYYNFANQILSAFLILLIFFWFLLFLDLYFYSFTIKKLVSKLCLAC